MNYAEIVRKKNQKDVSLYSIGQSLKAQKVCMYMYTAVLYAFQIIFCSVYCILLNFVYG